MTSELVGASLQKLHITSATLLACVDQPTCTGLTQVPTVTNEVVLDLYRFMCRHPGCTYLTLTQWLSCLYGVKWPKDQPPTVKSITQSVKRLLARLDKLKKLPSSHEKDKKKLEFNNEEYSLPVIFRAKGKLYKGPSLCTDLQSESGCTTESSNDESELENLKAVNEDLCRELAKLKLENASLKDVDSSFQGLREKVYSLHRNTNKKLGRRDKAILEQSERIDEQKAELEKMHKKVVHMEKLLQQVKQDKDRLRHKALYWKTKSLQIKSSSEEQELQESIEKQEEIENLKQDIQSLEEENVELQDKVQELTTTDEEIQTFSKGRYNDDVRTCCYELLSLNVGIRNVAPVIKTVMKTIAHQSIGRLPSQSALCRMMLEGLSLAEIQLGERLSDETQDNFTIQTDGTTKYGQHFATFDISTRDGSYTLGLRHVFSGSAQDTLDTLKEILEDLDMVQKEIGGASVSSKIISKLKNTMSDRHAAEKLFNELLADYRSDILPDVIAGWNEASETEKETLTRMNNFFCGLHFLVGLADCAEATLKVCEEQCGLLTAQKSSGTQRLIRTACKSFHARGSQQAGCSSQFRAHLRNKGIDKIPLAAFRGNRFNILFYDAAGIYFLKDHMLHYLSSAHGSLNLLLQAVHSDLKVPQYISGCRALGIVDKLVTGPLWRYLRLSTTSVLDMSDVYTKMKEKFEVWGEDSQAVLEGCDHLLQQHEKGDEVSKVLFSSSDNDCMVLELLQLLFKSFAATVQRLLLDHLPGGEFHSVVDASVVEETKSAPTTNVAPERDFAALDRLMSEKPNATHIALESLLLYSHNQTSSWLKSKPVEEREKLIKAARTLSPVQKARFLKRRDEINTRLQDAVRRKEVECIRKREKELRLKEALTKKIQAVGLWTSRNEIEEGLKHLKTAKSKYEALKLQINFRRKVLEQPHDDKSVFFFSHKGKQHTHTQLFSNLMKLLPTVQQPVQVDSFVHSPEALVNKRIEHLFDTDEGPQWYKGTVICYLRDSQEYKVLYDSEDCECVFPLLDDIAIGEVLVYDY